MVHMSLGKVIRKYRKIKNLTQEEMAGRLGVTAPAVSGYHSLGTDSQIIRNFIRYIVVIS